MRKLQLKCEFNRSLHCSLPVCRATTFVLILVHLIRLTDSKAQYVEPLNMGMKVSIGYDVANIFQFPIGGVLSTVLSVILALILLFGVITSPFGYFFGIPSRKYVMGGPPEVLPTKRFLTEFEYSNDSQIFETWTYPTFSESLFYLMPAKDLKETSCQLLIACSAHSVLQYFPDSMLRLYALFSRRLAEIPRDFKTAVISGIGEKAKCSNIYSECPDSEFSLIVKTFMNFLPDVVRNQKFVKRKQAMYI